VLATRDQHSIANDASGPTAAQARPQKAIVGNSPMLCKMSVGDGTRQLLINSYGLVANSLEAIPHAPAFRQDVHGMRWVALDLLSQMRDVESARNEGLRRGTRCPTRAREDRLVREHPARVVDQMIEQPCLGRAQRHMLARTITSRRSKIQWSDRHPPTTSARRARNQGKKVRKRSSTALTRESNSGVLKGLVM
jgi:hypothetical protein